MSAELELRQEPNPNLVTFEEHYHRRLRLPVRFNFEVQTKLAMFRRLAQNMPPLPEGASVLDLGCGRRGMLFGFPHQCLGATAFWCGSSSPAKGRDSERAVKIRE